GRGTDGPGGLAGGGGRLVRGVRRQRLGAGDGEVLEGVTGRGRRRRFGRGLVGRRLGGAGLVVEQEDVVVEAVDGDAGRRGRRLGLLAYRAADLVPELAQRGRLADTLPDGGDVLLRPRLHAVGQRLRGRVHRLLARHDAGQVVEDVALDDLPAFTRTAQTAPVDVVLLRQPSRQRGDVGLAHRSPPTRGGLAPALVTLVEREYTRPILRVWQGPISDISHSLRAAGDGADGSTAMLPACSPCRPRRPPRASAPARRSWTCGRRRSTPARRCPAARTCRSPRSRPGRSRRERARTPSSTSSARSARSASWRPRTCGPPGSPARAASGAAWRRCGRCWATSRTDASARPAGGR